MHRPTDLLRPHTPAVTWPGKHPKRAIADKGRAQGWSTLVPRDAWCDVRTLHGRDPDVLRHPTIAAAFAAVCAQWKPRHPIVLFSLCTSHRPYTQSRKWKHLAREFGGVCDLVVTSNGGIIPLPYEACFPFLNYDAHGEACFDALYIDILADRLATFLRACRYTYALFHFRHTLRNAVAAARVGPALVAEGVLRDFAVLPQREHLAQAEREGYRSTAAMKFPDLAPAMLAPVRAQVAAWRATLTTPP